MRRLPLVWLGAGIAALLVLVLAAYLFVQRMSAHVADVVAAPTSETELPVLWDAPAFSFPDQQGRVVSNESLRGTVWIANFIFTQCTSICPGMTARMVLLQTSLSDAQLGFVSFSVDPAHDTPEVLARYAQAWNARETRWRLLSTTPDGLARTAAGMKLTVQPTDDSENPILHSNRFLLVDAQSRVRGSYDSADDASMEQLVRDARSLVGGVHAAADRVDALADMDGKALFGALGCAACHADERVAPTLKGLRGREARLEGGRTRLADDAYLEESIVDPWAALVAGYGPTMPRYHEILSTSQVRALVEYLGSPEMEADAQSASSTPATSAEPQQVVDPICDMKVTVFPTTPSATFQGRVYYFCCETCQELFQKDPQSSVHQ